MAFEFIESTLIELPNVTSSLMDYSESAVRERHKLIIEQAAIHEGLTANYNHYSAAELEKSLPSWLQPYPKPLLINHDTEVSPLGRVMGARMDKSAEGVPFVRLQIGVTDPQAVEKVLDQRYMTGSVGGKAGSAKCSICGTDWAQAAAGYNAPCKHQRGKVYSGKLAYFELSDLSFKEYSFVNVPADQKSILINTHATESDDFSRTSKVFSLDMENESVVQYEESEQPKEILSSMKKKEAHYAYTNLKGTWLAVSAYYDLDKTNENITNNVDVTTMSNEALSDDNNVLGDSDHAEENLMSQNENVEATEELDITAVVEQLSDELAQVASEETADEQEESAEGEENTEAAEEPKEEEVQDLESDSTEEEDQPEENVDSSEGDSDEVEEEAEEVVEGEVEELADEVDSTEESQEAAPDERDALIEKLSNENKQLRGMLHKMLAERVIDKKIDLGIISMNDRVEALAEHATRSASSLADTLKDLHKLSPMVTSPLESISNLHQDTNGGFASGSDPVEAFEDGTPKEMPISKAEKMFTDVLMGRQAL